MSPKDQPIDYSKPVAYDAHGRPLYAHPPQAAAAEQQPMNIRAERSSHVTNAPDPEHGHGFDPATRVQYSNEPAVAHVTRPVEPDEIPMSDEMTKKHEESKRMFPNLNLSKGEHVLLAVHRHPIGLALPVLGTGFVLLLILSLALGYPFLETNSSTGVSLPPYEAILLVSALLGILVSIFGYIAVWIYQRNQFFLTNESVIQEIQTSLFAKHEQTASLGSIEDVSFKKTNIFEVFFDFGTIRLSTEGEETTYRFHYVSNPKRQVAILNNAVEDFKNGRPVSPHEN